MQYFGSVWLLFSLREIACFLDAIYVDKYVGVTNIYYVTYVAVISFTVIAPSSLISVVLTFVLLVELHKMRPADIAHRTMSPTELLSSLLQAPSYFLTCLTPRIIGAIVASTDFEVQLPEIVYHSIVYSAIVLNLNDLFGIFNTILHKWLNKNYRIAFLTMLTAGRLKNRVTDTSAQQA